MMNNLGSMTGRTDIHENTRSAATEDLLLFAPIVQGAGNSAIVATERTTSGRAAKELPTNQKRTRTGSGEETKNLNKRSSKHCNYTPTRIPLCKWHVLCYRRLNRSMYVGSHSDGTMTIGRLPFTLSSPMASCLATTFSF